VKDKIQSVANVAGVRAQMQNAGRAHISGVELGARGSAGAWLDFGGNYTYTDMKNVSDRAIRLTDVPRHKLTAHAVLHAAPGRRGGHRRDEQRPLGLEHAGAGRLYHREPESRVPPHAVPEPGSGREQPG
jgi:outer membrane receptor protein involved in Fe transport